MIHLLDSLLVVFPVVYIVCVSLGLVVGWALVLNILWPGLIVKGSLTAADGCIK